MISFKCSVLVEIATLLAFAPLVRGIPSNSVILSIFYVYLFSCLSQVFFVTRIIF